MEMVSIIFQGDSRSLEKRLLAVGGIYVFEEQPRCKLVQKGSESIVTDLDWSDTLALEAKHEGVAEVVCDTKIFKLQVVVPTRLDIETLESKITKIAVHERFKVQARLYDRRGRELEVGKFTIFKWSSFGVLEIANDSSSGEFGFCDTCYGMYGFRTVRPGKGSIEASLGDLRGKLKVEFRN